MLGDLGPATESALDQKTSQEELIRRAWATVVASEESAPELWLISPVAFLQLKGV
jgi:hypothetical protein